MTIAEVPREVNNKTATAYLIVPIGETARNQLKRFIEIEKENYSLSWRGGTKTKGKWTNPHALYYSVPSEKKAALSLALEKVGIPVDEIEFRETSAAPAPTPKHIKDAGRIQALGDSYAAAIKAIEKKEADELENAQRLFDEETITAMDYAQRMAEIKGRYASEKNYLADHANRNYRTADDVYDNGESLNTNQPLPFHILGHNKQRQILIRYNGCVVKIPVGQLRKDELRLLVGGDTSYFQDKDQSEILKNRIIDEARKNGFIDDENAIKTGVWKNGKLWVIISGDRSATFEAGEFKNLDDPIINGRIIETHGGEWLDWEELNRCLKCDDAVGLLKDAFLKIRSKTATWSWFDPSMADYATAFIMLSPVQQAMVWRPWLWLSGAKSSGKTTFFEDLLNDIFGSLAERLDKSTAHATAQTVGTSGRIPIFDEFEKNKHLGDVLELLKLCNKGGIKSSGTSAEKPYRFELHHMPWLGSIYQPVRALGDAAQKSRMIKLDMRKLKDSVSPFEKFGQDESRKIAAQIVAAMMLAWDSIDSGRKEIKAKQEAIIKGREGITIRTIENYMYASAILNLIHQCEKHTVPEWAALETEDDSDMVLSTILNSKTYWDGGDKSISELLELVRTNPNRSELEKHLWNCGLAITSTENKKYLAVRCDVATRYLLKDTDYKDLDIRGPLARLDGAIDGHLVKRSGKGERCVVIPLFHIDSSYTD